MKSPIIDSSITWLTTDPSQRYDHCSSKDVFRHPIPMPEDVGTGYIEVQNLCLGMTLSRGVHQFTTEATGNMLPLAQVKGTLSEPAILIQTAKKGRVLLREFAANVELLFDRYLTVFQHVSHIDYLPVLDSTEDIEVAVLHIGESVLPQYLGMQVADALLTALRIKNIPVAHCVKVPPHISAILHSCHSTYLRGELRKLFSQAKVLEYLCSLAEHFTQEKPDSSMPEKNVTLKIYEELTRLEGKVPSLNDIAMNYGMSLKSLNRGFKEMFGQTVFNCIYEHRLQEAHSILLQSNVPMKVLAGRLGYSHVNHFIAAFKKKFGYTPGSLRKK